jgi:hypothetical protein
MPFLLANWRILLVCCIFATYSAFLYRIGSAPYRAELDKIKASGKSQQEFVGKINKQQDDNRKVIENEVQAQLKAAADNAVANYRKRYPVRMCNLPSSPVPGQAIGKQGNDGTASESVAAGAYADPVRNSLQTGRVPEIISDDFVRACGEDAAKLNAWQHWALLNGIPVK